MVFNESWHNGVNLCAIAQESHAAFPVNPYGIGIQEGSLCLAFYTLGVPFWGTFSVVPFPSGAWAPFFGAIPSFWFTCDSVLDATTSRKSLIK